MRIKVDLAATATAALYLHRILLWLFAFKKSDAERRAALSKEEHRASVKGIMHFYDPLKSF